MLVIFPFEEQFYRERGVKAEFVGHPLAELPLPDHHAARNLPRENRLDPARTWIGLLPGSRAKEIRDNLPEMLEAAQLLLPRLRSRTTAIQSHEFVDSAGAHPRLPAQQASRHRMIVDQTQTGPHRPPGQTTPAPRSSTPAPRSWPAEPPPSKPLSSAIPSWWSTASPRSLMLSPSASSRCLTWPWPT